MMLLGLLWAAAAPLLLLLPAALLAHGLQRARPAWSHRRRRAVAGALTLAAVATLWVPERLHFAQLCTDLGPPRVLQRAQADGIFLDDPTANSFGTRYLYDEGFTWMEARSIYRRDAFTRYRKVDGRPERITLGRFNQTLPDSRDFPQGTDLLKSMLGQPELNVRMASTFPAATASSLTVTASAASTLGSSTALTLRLRVLLTPVWVV